MGEPQVLAQARQTSRTSSASPALLPSIRGVEAGPLVRLFQTDLAGGLAAGWIRV